MPQLLEIVVNGLDGVPYPPPSPNPLLEDDALIEATLLDILCPMHSATVALLFDLRTSLYMEAGNTGLLILRHVSQMAVEWFEPSKQFQVWVVGTSKVQYGDDGCLVNIDNRIICKCESAEFIAGTVNGIGEVAQSLDDGVWRYLNSTPNWNSPIVISACARISTR
jgi:hypothetical protein